MSERLKIRTLGGLTIQLDGQPVIGFDSRKVPALLVYLASTERAHPREVLAEMFWEERTQSQALSNLRVALTNLRQTVGQYVDITRETVSIRPNSGWHLDAAEFEALAGGATNDVAQLAVAMDLYQGSFLEGFYIDSNQFEEWTLLERERLRFSAMTALDQLVAHHTATGNNTTAIAAAMRLLQLDNLREETHRTLMLLLAQSRQRTMALAQYDTLRELLANEMGVEPMIETQMLYEQIRAGNIESLQRASNPAVSEIAVTHHLPTQSTPFIGRETEIASLIAQIEDPDCRLLTLVGPGGIGKTRLALEITDRVKEAFAHGAHFVPLASVTTPDGIASAIMTVLGLPLMQGDEPLTEQLIGALSGLHALLVLDSFEHLTRCTDLVDRLLTEAAHVVVVATSREPLNLEWEWHYEVHGLATPSPDEAAVESSDALRLFADRARRVQPAFRLADEGDCVFDICCMIEGMPLGIELAASWLRVLTCSEIAGDLFNLEHQLSHVADRHRSLRAIFEQTWARLSNREQDTLMRLSVFHGGFAREAAESVASTTLPVLAALINKSLVRRDPTSGRFDLHRMWQHYATEHLRAFPDEYERTATYHSAYFAALVDRHASLIHAGQGQTILLEIENIRTAWQTAVAHGVASHVRQFIDGLSWLYELQGWHQDAIGLFEPAVNVFRSDAPSGDAGIAYGRLLGLLGWFKGRCGERNAGYQLVQEGIAILRELNAHEEIAMTQLLLGRLANTHAEIAAAYQLCEESLQQLDGGGLSRIASAHIVLAELANALGDYEAAQRHAQLGENINREIDSPRGYAGAVRAQGDAAAGTGDHATAEQRYRESLATYQELGYRQGMIWSLRGLGRLALAQDNDSAAWGYFREALEIVIDLELMPQVLETTMNLAEILVRREDWRRVAEIVSLARYHRATNANTRTAVDQILAEHNAELAPLINESVARQSEQQIAIQLDLVVAELLDL